jgi:hypothetical protein
LLNDSGFPGIKLEKKIDFHKLYKEKFNWKNFSLNLFLSIPYEV